MIWIDSVRKYIIFYSQWIDAYDMFIHYTLLPMMLKNSFIHFFIFTLLFELGWNVANLENFHLQMLSWPFLFSSCQTDYSWCFLKPKDSVVHVNQPLHKSRTFNNDTITYANLHTIFRAAPWYNSQTMLRCSYVLHKVSPHYHICMWLFP